VAGCATRKGLSSFDRLKIEGDLTHLESFLLAKEQASSNTRWRSIADQIVSVREKSYDICSSAYGRSTLSQVFNASRQLNTDTQDINKRITELESYIGSLPQEHLPFVYINRLNTIKSRSRIYASSQKEESIK